MRGFGSCPRVLPLESARGGAIEKGEKKKPELSGGNSKEPREMNFILQG